MLFTFPSRYLFTIGHQGVFRLGGWSPHVQTGFHVSRPTRGPAGALRVRGYHPLWPDFPDRSASPPQATGLIRVRSPLLTESLLMSVPPGTEMFQFPGFASPAYVFSGRYPIGVGCPIQISTDQRLLAAPHGFSQRATSFIASWCQGIHRMPLSRSRTLGRRRQPPASAAMRRNHPHPKNPDASPPATRRHASLSTHILWRPRPITGRKPPRRP